MSAWLLDLVCRALPLTRAAGMLVVPSTLCCRSLCQQPIAEGVQGDHQESFDAIDGQARDRTLPTGESAARPADLLWPLSCWPRSQRLRRQALTSATSCVLLDRMIRTSTSGTHTVRHNAQRPATRAIAPGRLCELRLLVAPSQLVSPLLCSALFCSALSLFSFGQSSALPTPPTPTTTSRSSFRCRSSTRSCRQKFSSSRDSATQTCISR